MQLKCCAPERKETPLPVILPDVRHLRAKVRNTPDGDLAVVCGDDLLVVAVIRSAAGFYIGTTAKSGDGCRVSAEYWRHREAAEEALANGWWTLRYDPLMPL